MSDKQGDLTPPEVTDRKSRGSWVQTERAAHEAWSELVRRQPRAAQLLHLLVANMDARGTLVASQPTLAAMMGVSKETVKRAVKHLVTERWVQRVRVGSERGGTNAYRVNSRIAWADKRENLRFARFSASVLVSDKDEPQLDGPELRQIPTMAPGEQQLPAGDGEPPPSQAALDGMEPDLPAIVTDDQGRRWAMDPVTGELQGLIE